MLSLKARAIAHLARRDHGRDELREKLLRPPRPAPARRLRSDPGAGADADPDALGPAAANAGHDPAATDPADPAAVTPEAVDAVLDALEAGGWLDDRRAAASRAAARASRQGLRRIEADLARRGLRLDADTLAGLKASELERARDVWRRRFGAPPADARERARHWRFLTGRGFDAATVARVIGGGPDGDDDPG